MYMNINPLSDLCVANTNIPHSLACLLTLFMIPFNEQKFLILMKLHL